MKAARPFSRVPLLRTAQGSEAELLRTLGARYSPSAAFVGPLVAVRPRSALELQFFALHRRAAARRERGFALNFTAHFEGLALHARQAPCKQRGFALDFTAHFEGLALRARQAPCKQRGFALNLLSHFEGVGLLF